MKFKNLLVAAIAAVILIFSGVAAEACGGIGQPACEVGNPEDLGIEINMEMGVSGQTFEGTINSWGCDADTGLWTRSNMNVSGASAGAYSSTDISIADATSCRDCNQVDVDIYKRGTITFDTGVVGINVAPGGTAGFSATGNGTITTVIRVQN